MATDFHDTVTIPLPQPGAGPQMSMVEVALIEESTTNPRKHFDATKLQELADSIAATGVHQPILLRPLPGHRVPDTWGFRRKDAPLPAYELVAGARRLRACRLAKVAEIPAMIRELTDEQALEIQVIENLQREDVTPLEEAEGYEALMHHGHADADAVAAKIGKSRSYVYARLKLLDLTPDCRQALREGKIDASRALRIARIPDAKLQAKALAEASRTNYRGDPAMGVREFEGWLQQNVMLRLEQAPFPTTAINLVDGVGSCMDCPKRTGAEPDLFTDVNSPDLCTDPACHARKAQAHSEQLRAAAEAKGMRVIDGKEAKGIVNLQSWDGHNNMLKGYSRLDSVRHDVASGQERATLRELLGDKGPQAVMIEHPQTKELIEAVPTEEAEAVLVQRGLLQTTCAKIDVEERIRSLKNQSAAKQARAAQAALYKAFMAGAHQSPAPAKVLADAELLREWLKLALLDLDLEDIYDVTGIEPIEDEDYRLGEERAIARVDRAKDGEVRNMMLAWMVQFNAYRFAGDQGQPLVEAISRALGIDADAIADEAVAAEKAELKEAIANVRAAAKAQADREASKAEAPKGASPHDPAAPASAVRGGGKAKKKGPAAPAGGEAPKTSAAHASAQIAEALAALEGEHDQAPAAQGNESPPVPDGQAAGGVAPGADDGALHPAAAWPFPPKAVRALAAASRAAPGGDGSADVSDGAAAKPVAIGVGVRVRINDSATGKVQKPWIDYEGVVAAKVGDRAWDVDIERSKRSAPKRVMFDVSELEVLA